jgi:hypothetical protein
VSGRAEARPTACYVRRFVHCRSGFSPTIRAEKKFSLAEIAEPAEKSQRFNVQSFFRSARGDARMPWAQDALERLTPLSKPLVIRRRRHSHLQPEMAPKRFLRAEARALGDAAQRNPA